MAEYQILSWRDMPAQIRVYKNGRPKSYKLPERFQLAIDQVAMDDGIVNTDAYLEQWSWSEKMTREGNPEDVAQALVEELSQS